MKKTTIILVLILALLFSVSGCGESATQKVEQGKSTVEYLTGKYAQKLRDNNTEVYTGKVTEAKSLSGNIEQITFVEADKNSDKEAEPKELLLEQKMEIVYITNSNPDGAVMDGKQFVKAFVPGKNDIFEVFVKDDKVVLLLSVKS